MQDPCISRFGYFFVSRKHPSRVKRTATGVTARHSGARSSPRRSRFRSRRPVAAKSVMGNGLLRASMDVEGSLVNTSGSLVARRTQTPTVQRRAQGKAMARTRAPLSCAHLVVSAANTSKERHTATLLRSASSDRWTPKALGHAREALQSAPISGVSGAQTRLVLTPEPCTSCP